ncbi:MAG: hypothetical protein ACPL4E_04880 [Thermoproteota archaeon]
MPSTPFETVILTTALYAVLFISLLMFSIVYRWVFIDSLKVRLGEVANQVAYEVTGLYVMCHRAESNINLYKPISLPVSVSGHGYAMEFREVDGVWFLVAYLEENRAINVSSPLWRNPGVDVVVETGDGVFQVGSRLVNYTGVLHSGASNPVVWARRVDGAIVVGLGRLENSGGG